MQGDLPWLFPSGPALANAASGAVMAYFAFCLLAGRGTSKATRALGLVLAASSVNLMGLALLKSAFHPEVGTVARLFSSLALFAIPLFVIEFAYRFPVEHSPRERRLALAVGAMVLLPIAVRAVVLAAGGRPTYDPGSQMFFNQVDSEWLQRFREATSFYSQWYVQTATYGFGLFVLLRSCVRHERETGGTALRGLWSPKTRNGRAARDFAALALGTALIPVLHPLGWGAAVPLLTLLLACAVIRVHINHSAEPTPLRFKLVTIPLALVVGIQGMQFSQLMDGDRARVEEGWSLQAARIRRAVERGQPLTEIDVGPDVAMVVSRPMGTGAYATDFTPLFVRDGYEAGELGAMEAEEEAWLTDWWIRTGADRRGRRPPPEEADIEERRRLLLAAFGAGRHGRWSIAGEWAFVGHLRERGETFGARYWSDGEDRFLVLWPEVHRRDALSRLAEPFGLVILLTAVVLVLGLPLLFRASLLRPIAALLAGVQRVDEGDLTGRVDLRTQDELGRLANSFDHMVASLQESRANLERVNAAAFRFVPRPFLKLLGHESVLDVALGDQSRRTMTVMFADIRGFTSLSERMTPDETFAFVNDLLRELGPIVRRHGGFIDKYLGDAIMALFDEGVDEALAAVVEMREALARINADRSRRGEDPVHLGFGVHTGELMLGVIGEEERIDGTVLADAVNTASRLEGLTKRYGAAVVVSAESLQALREPAQFETRVLERVRIKGREEPLEVCEVLSGDRDDRVRAKTFTREVFEASLRSVQKGEFEVARSGFASVLEADDHDMAARLHLDLATRYATEGPPPDWDGVHIMESK